MSKGYILSGSLFGDEGKGSFVDYLSHEKGINRNVRYNGGNQASHTVTLDNGICHKFSQLGSSMFVEDNKTFLSENTIINLFNLVEEAKRFSETTGVDFQKIIDNVLISSNIKVTTPYHLLTNQIRELSRNQEKRGSVGTGVSEVINVFEDTNLCLYVSDLFNGRYIDVLDELYFYTRDFFKNNLAMITDAERKHLNEKDIHYLTDSDHRSYIRECYKNLLSTIRFNVIDKITEFSSGQEDILFEGSQGLLLDRIYGIKPNTTLLDTTNHYAVKLANELGIQPLKIGIVKAFASRHGLGILPTYDEDLSRIIFDDNQESTYFQGREPIYGWFDSALLRYTQKINNNDEYYVSCLDKLKDFDVLKICNSYSYRGVIDADFEETFAYHTVQNKIVITDIKQNSPKLKEFLSKCTPIYIEMPGFKGKDNYSEYIKTIEELTGIKITLLSIGPKQSDKVRRLVR